MRKIDEVCGQSERTKNTNHSTVSSVAKKNKQAKFLRKVTMFSVTSVFVSLCSGKRYKRVGDTHTYKFFTQWHVAKRLHQVRQSTPRSL